MNFASDIQAANLQPTSGSSAVPTLEELRAMIRADASASQKDRHDDIDALNALEILCQHHDRLRAAEAGAGGKHPTGESYGQDKPAPILMTPADLMLRLAAASPATLGCSRKRLSNIRSRIRKILRRIGTHAPDYHKDTPLSPAWLACRELVTSRFDKIALAAPARYFSERGIAPEAITFSMLEEFVAWRATHTTATKPVYVAQRFVRLSNQLRDAVPGWPMTRLHVPKKRQPWTFPFSMFPLSLQEDIERFAKRLGEGDDDDFFGLEDEFDMAVPAGKPRSKPARPTTVARACSRSVCPWPRSCTRATHRQA